MNRDLIERVEYRSGFLESGRRPDDLPVWTWESQSLPQLVKDSISRERLFELSGVFGDKAAGDPVEYDFIRLVGADKKTTLTVFNRGIALFFLDDERIRRIHRVLCLLRNLSDRSPIL